ncbi:hypothetical protein [Deinococcus sp.]|uniref:hypothetical protein n=1 Tax=Deinococcus sp. TaxID=47478 RepID=UPI0025BE4629|nr:hypothetical protein [Deinococcus sp.]
MSEAAGHYDIVGDIHGCLDEFNVNGAVTGRVGQALGIEPGRVKRLCKPFNRSRHYVTNRHWHRLTQRAAGA